MVCRGLPKVGREVGISTYGEKSETERIYLQLTFILISQRERDPIFFIPGMVSVNVGGWIHHAFLKSSFTIQCSFAPSMTLSFLVQSVFPLPLIILFSAAHVIFFQPLQNLTLFLTQHHYHSSNMTTSSHCNCFGWSV